MKIAIPSPILDNIDNQQNKRYLLNVISSRLAYIKHNTKFINNYTLAQIYKIVSDLMSQFTTYHYQNLIITTNLEMLTGINVEFYYLMVMKGVTKYTSHINHAINQSFKNKILKRLHQLNPNQLYVYNHNTLIYHLATNGDMIQYLSELRDALYDC